MESERKYTRGTAPKIFIFREGKWVLLLGIPIAKGISKEKPNQTNNKKIKQQNETKTSYGKFLH